MPHLKTTAIFLFLSISIACCQDGGLHQQFHQIAKGYQSVFGFSGNIKVVKDDKGVFEQSYGLANRSFGIENTPQTRFSINSISKTFTAAAILMLASDQKIGQAQMRVQKTAKVWVRHDVHRLVLFRPN